MDTLSRCFLSIELPQGVKEHIARSQQELRRRGAPNGFKVTPAGELAIHLVHLGELRPMQIEQVKMETQDAARSFAPFLLRLQGVAAHPNAIQPRDLFAAMTEGKSDVDRIASTLSLKAPPQPANSLNGVEIGRLRTPDEKSRTDLGRALRVVKDAEFGDWTVDRIFLMRSVADSQGPHLEALAAFSLGS